MMIKRDEQKLFKLVEHTGKWPRAIAKAIGMHPKRCRYICDKWADKGIYEYGVSVEMGWLTPFWA